MTPEQIKVELLSKEQPYTLAKELHLLSCAFNRACGAQMRKVEIDNLSQTLANLEWTIGNLKTTQAWIKNKDNKK